MKKDKGLLGRKVEEVLTVNYSFPEPQRQQLRKKTIREVGSGEGKRCRKARKEQMEEWRVFCIRLTEVE